jgi:hypothetical protein
MDKPRSLFRKLMVIGSLSLMLAAGAIVGAPSATADFTGECGGATLSSHPRPGSRVAPGRTIVYIVTVQVTGGSVTGCAQDVRTSPLLDFVSIKRTGIFFPDFGGSPLATVTWEGPFDEGTTLRGRVTMRVPAAAQPGAEIVTTSGPLTIQHTVGRRTS